MQTTDTRKPLTITFIKPSRREMDDLPESIIRQFLVGLERISWGLNPGLPITHLQAAGKGVMELKINGRPAYRLIYTTKYEGELVVLVARSKTSNGPDKKLIEVAASRVKGLKNK